MIARSSVLKLNGLDVARTPLLIPSFSSKGFPEVRKIIEFSSEFITDVTLVSAYDISHELIDPEVSFAELVFLDSGGYESAQDYDFAEIYKREHQPESWDLEKYTKVVDAWQPEIPTVVVTFDHPKQFLSIEDQITQANALRNRREDVLWEILLKPETDDQRFVPMDKVIERVHTLADFDLIGLAEKELAGSYRKRVYRVGELRLALDNAGVKAPIHIFGCLYPVTAPLYFLAGAEVFDGLTWLRLAFRDGRTIHVSSAAAELEFGTQRSETDLFQYIWSSNLYYLNDLRLKMSDYVEREDLSRLVTDVHFYESELQQLDAYLKERS